MATTQIAKLLIRQGDFADLPILDPGELGYAKDDKRLFIGNDPISFTGDGSTSYTVGIDVTKKGQYRVTKTNNGTVTEYSSSGFSISGTTITFTTAPTASDTVRVYHNSEIGLIQEAASFDTLNLTAGSSDAETGISWNATTYNSAIIDYSISNVQNAAGDPGFRVGTMKINIDTRSTVDDYYLQDDFGGVNNVDVDFAGSYDNSTNIFTLKYTDNDNSAAQFSYSIRLWKQNLA